MRKGMREKSGDSLLGNKGVISIGREHFGGEEGRGKEDQRL